MLIMKVEEYRIKMEKLGWSSRHIDQLIGIYQNCSKIDDERIKVLEGDFNKKNLRIFEARF